MYNALSPSELAQLDAYWRASNYLSVGQIYLLDNPLLRKPLKREHVKPRLVGHWGTTPGLNLLYVHLNRVIAAHDLNVLFITGPGHGGPALVAQAYLEKTYTEVYPDITEDEVGMQKLFKQFSFPGGIPSHVAPETPGSIHEGGELGYSLSHAFGAAFDNPDLIVAAVVGDGEAETGPLATSWHSNKFLNPVTDCLTVLVDQNRRGDGGLGIGRWTGEDLKSDGSVAGGLGVQNARGHKLRPGDEISGQADDSCVRSLHAEASGFGGSPVGVLAEAVRRETKGRAGLGFGVGRLGSHGLEDRSHERPGHRTQLFGQCGVRRVLGQVGGIAEEQVLDLGRESLFLFSVAGGLPLGDQ